MKTLLVALLLVLTGCASASSVENVDASEDELRARYDDLTSTLDEADLERWMAVRASLASGFDRVCADTICGGDYTNLTTVRIACSSTTIARKMKDCTWVLGGSVDQVDGISGEIKSEPRVFTCPIAASGSAKKMLDALAPAGEDALFTVVPATGRSFYDGLVDCFAGVVAPSIAAKEGSHVDLGEHTWRGGAAWNEARQKLAISFDQACGDTYCEGEYPDLTPLRLVCSVDTTSEHVSACNWSFAAAELSVDPRGRFVARTDVRRCAIAIDGSASDLLATLSSPDPLRAMLPGKTSSIADALSDCL